MKAGSLASQSSRLVRKATWSPSSARVVALYSPSPVRIGRCGRRRGRHREDAVGGAVLVGGGVDEPASVVGEVVVRDVDESGLLTARQIPEDQGVALGLLPVFGSFCPAAPPPPARAPPGRAPPGPGPPAAAGRSAGASSPSAAESGCAAGAFSRT